MTDPVRDDEALFRVFDYARNHPENWNQNQWRQETECGTTYCIAGFQTYVMDQKTPLTYRDVYGPAFTNAPTRTVRDDNGNLVDVQYYATKSLGLNAEEADALFYCFDHDDIEGVVKDIMNNKYREQ